MQVLLSLGMANLTYFMACSSIFFKYGNIKHIPSLVLFIVGTFCLLLLFLKFYTDPDPFGQFRYSFKTKYLAVNHYFLLILVVMSATGLMVALPQYSFAPLPPYILILVFTLIYQPYREVKENYRSAFNHLVVCSFIGMRIYIQYTDENNINAPPTFVFLLVNIVILLFTVVVVGLISSIYYFYYYRYIKPK